MRDIETILRRIKLGMVCVPLMAAPMVLDAHAGPPDKRRGGPYKCGGGDWQTTAAVAKKAAPTGAKEVLGCATALDSKKLGPPKKGDDQQPKVGTPGRPVTITLEEALTRAAQKQQSDACVYEWVQMCPGRGRPMLDPSGRAILAETEPGTAWCGDVHVQVVDAALAARLAELWLDDARAEHASVAAFSRAALELMSLGAPPELIAGCHRAALEEIEHAQMCFALAAHYGATNVAPGGLTGAAPRATDRVRLAVDTFLEGCVGETIAALSLHRAATRCADPGVTAILTRMANEEADHAALAWSTVRWAATGRTDVLEAVQSAASTLELPTPTPAPADDLSAWGRLSDADEARAAQDALRDLVHPMLAQVSDS